MKKWNIRIMITVITFLILGTLLFSNMIFLPMHKKVYIECLEQMKTNLEFAVDQYMHYEDPAEAELTKNAGYFITHYEIIEVKKLSDNLWLFHTYIQHEMNLHGQLVYHFVGIIDGEYRVMTNGNQVPNDLKEGLDLSPYTKDPYEDL